MLLVQNRSRLPIEVPITLVDGTKTSVFIQPLSKAKLPDGASVPRQHNLETPQLQVMDLATGKFIDPRLTLDA